jgi:hypothetical protein
MLPDEPDVLIPEVNERDPLTPELPALALDTVIPPLEVASP